jgi:hypothetical protein
MLMFQANYFRQIVKAMFSVPFFFHFSDSCVPNSSGWRFKLVVQDYGSGRLRLMVSARLKRRPAELSRETSFLPVHFQCGAHFPVITKLPQLAGGGGGTTRKPAHLTICNTGKSVMYALTKRCNAMMKLSVRSSVKTECWS